MNTDTTGEKSLTAETLPAFPPARPYLEHPAILNTGNERMARLAFCSICNAPPTVACQSILWDRDKPRLRVRPHHPRRYKEYMRIREQARLLEQREKEALAEEAELEGAR